MTASINRTMTPGQWATLAGLSVLWGASFLFIDVAVAALPVFTVVATRVALGGLVLYAVLRLSRDRLPRAPSAWAAFAAVAIMNNVIPFSLLGWGQSHIASGLAAILNATTPLFGAIVAHFWTRDEPLTANRLLGVLLGIIGIVVMIGTHVFGELGVNVLAELACVGAALAYGVSGVYGRRFARLGVSPLTTATGQMTCSALIMVALALAVDRPWTLSLPGVHVIGALVGLAVLSTALAYILFYRLLAKAGATNTLLVTILVPVFAIFFGATLLGERLELRHFVGFGIVVLGLAATDGRAWAAIRRRARLARTREAE